VTSLATSVAGLCEGFECASVVDVHRNTRGKCTRRGVHCCRDHSGGGMCKGNLTDLRRILHLSLAKGNPK
jgi:hypothetical protein